MLARQYFIASTLWIVDNWVNYCHHYPQHLLSCFQSVNTTLSTTSSRVSGNHNGWLDTDYHPRWTTYRLSIIILCPLPMMEELFARGHYQIIAALNIRDSNLLINTTPCWDYCWTYLIYLFEHPPRGFNSYTTFYLTAKKYIRVEPQSRRTMPGDCSLCVYPVKMAKQLILL